MWMAWPERSGGWKVVEGEPLDSAAGFCAQEEEGGRGRRGTLVFEGVGKRWKMGWNASADAAPTTKRERSGSWFG